MPEGWQRGRTVVEARCALAQVVAVLNPNAGEQMQRQLEEQIAGMQAELAVAHTQVGAADSALCAAGAA